MRKAIIFLFGLVVIIATVSSCKKRVLPLPGGGGGTDTTPHTAPPPPKLEETLPPILTGITDSISQNIRGYYESLPARYNESEEKYPVIIDFHGGGQYGNGAEDLHKVILLGIPKLIADGKFPPSFTVGDEKFSFIVIAPQLVKEVANVEILNLLNYVEHKYRVDSSRVYITGFSKGGRQAANYGSLRPEKFAAMVTFGGLPQIDGDLITKCQSMANAHLPVWHFHNVDDSAWAYSEAVEYIRVFDSINPVIPPRFTSFPIGEGKSHHDCWTKTTDPAYKEDGKNIYEWMLGYKRED